MKRTIAAIHATYKAVEPMMKAFRTLAPQYEIVNYVNEELLAAVNRSHGPGKKELRMFSRLIFEAMESEADAILVCCSVFCAYVPLMRNFSDVPIVAVNEPMLRRAAGIGGRIGVISTTEASAPKTQEQIEEILKEMGKKAVFSHEIAAEAMTALRRGDEKEHNRMIARQAEELRKQGCDCVVLSQITIAQAKDEIPKEGCPILTSPEECVREICRLCGDRVEGA